MQLGKQCPKSASHFGILAVDGTTEGITRRGKPIHSSAVGSKALLSISCVSPLDFLRDGSIQ
jgi:hypothetical protein